MEDNQHIPNAFKIVQKDPSGGAPQIWYLHPNGRLTGQGNEPVVRLHSWDETRQHKTMRGAIGKRLTITIVQEDETDGV